jgi:hypothetical protein
VGTTGRVLELDLAQSCHPQTLRQMRWADAHLKITSPQIIAS